MKAINIDISDFSNITTDMLEHQGYNQIALTHTDIFESEQADVIFMDQRFEGSFNFYDGVLQSIKLTPAFTDPTSDGSGKDEYCMEFLNKNTHNYLILDTHWEYGYSTYRWTYPHCVVCYSEAKTDKGSILIVVKDFFGDDL